MTNAETHSPVERLSKQVADRYAGEGYEVLAGPNAEQLPDFLRPFRPDMIARKGDQNVVIEIKPSAESELPSLKAIAAAVARHPRWRLDVVIGDAAPPLSTQSIGELGTQLAEARGLLENHAVAGELLLWSVFEGVARHAMAKHGMSLSPGLSGQALAKSLLANGFIEDDEFDRLLDAARRRNGLAHGFATPPDRQLASIVLEVTERLLRETPEDRAA